MKPISRLFIFNPDSEMAIANGSRFYMPPANIVRMAEELAFLPAYFSEQGDALYMKQKPENSFLQERERIFGLTPRILSSQEEIDANMQAEPWGWSPRMCAFLGKESIWSEERKELYSRRTAAKVLAELQAKLPFAEKGAIPKICTSVKEVEEVVQEGSFMIKAPWSSSGKGVLKVGNEGIDVKQREWLIGVLHRQKYVMVERYLDKVLDFAMEFYSDGNSQLTFAGFSTFQTDGKGKYKGNYVYAQSQIKDRIAGLLGNETLKKVLKELPEVLCRHILPFYTGYFGVDMMIYRNARGELKIQPCVEINLRYTMGILAFYINKRWMAEPSKGFFTIHYFPAPGEALKFHTQALRDYPLLMEAGKIVSGYIHLTPVREDTKFHAALYVSDSSRRLPFMLD